MFHRAELKQKAKEVLAKSYWMCFAACAIIFVISGVASGIFRSFNIYTGLMGETAYISPVKFSASLTRWPLPASPM